MKIVNWIRVSALGFCLLAGSASAYVCDFKLVVINNTSQNLTVQPAKPDEGVMANVLKTRASDPLTYKATSDTADSRHIHIVATDANQQIGTLSYEYNYTEVGGAGQHCIGVRDKSAIYTPIDGQPALAVRVGYSDKNNSDYGTITATFTDASAQKK